MRLSVMPASQHSPSLTSLAQAPAFELIALSIASLVNQRNRAVSLLATSELHYRSMTETASDVVITIDSQSRINPAPRQKERRQGREGSARPSLYTPPLLQWDP
jgi:PAS domain-containing protein